MPKGKQKGKFKSGAMAQKLKLPETNLSTSDEDSLNDNASVFSGFSENKSVLEEDEVDEQSQEEIFEEKLQDAIDGMNQKSAQGRTSSIDSVARAFTMKFVPEFVSTRYLTLTDAIERSFKKGGSLEQVAAAQLAPLICIQLGSGDYAENVCKILTPVLLTIASDKTAPSQARSKCCWALSLCSFIAGGELGDVLQQMQTLESIFSGSYLKGDGTKPTVSSDIALLHSSALSSWSLLFTLLSPGDVYAFMSEGNNSSFVPQVEHLCELLDSVHLDVRISAGETIALVYELGRSHDSDFQQEFTLDLSDRLRQLATDSHKYRAKKDRKQQRSSFRDILRFIEEEHSPDIQIRFGQEILILDSWCRKKQYDTFCQALGSGFNLHLMENNLVREVFELGEKISVTNTASLKQSKMERNLMNAAAFKARTISRAKNRDKRSAAMIC